ncbi:hemolysin III family protein [Aliiglaciecola sp. LCG003]|uniref:PAQR family membrane homeostasis protein TrhA n=1 Tax=Aliiglaciecola sp. LCG003 TaxID=3053655 RepID=UPI00257280D9|nr:hemolysin III family protein [Aliiglaciecola sp. LCG003]WJG10435.1 hemolysin III family protein [Aliiglaciecola sp. LCG003]
MSNKDLSTQSALPVKGYTLLEEVMNAVSHGLGLIFSIVGTVYLLMRSDSTVAMASSAIYGASLTIMFFSSTIYHSVTGLKAKGFFKLVDHSAIYVLIAGTYTPFLAVSIGGWIGWTSIAVIWSIALFGVIFKCFAQHRFPKLSLVTYLVMGWLAVILIYPLYQSVAGYGLLLLVAGGLCFSIGVIFYMQKAVKFTHAIWHLFVIAGCACHYYAIYYFVI